MGSIPGLGRSLEEGMTTHSTILAWRIQWTEEPGGLQSMESQRVRAHMHTVLIHIPHFEPMLSSYITDFLCFHIYGKCYLIHVPRVFCRF